MVCRNWPKNHRIWWRPLDPLSRGLPVVCPGLVKGVSLGRALVSVLIHYREGMYVVRKVYTDPVQLSSRVLPVRVELIDERTGEITNYQECDFDQWCSVIAARRSYAAEMIMSGSG